MAAPSVNRRAATAMPDAHPIPMPDPVTADDLVSTAAEAASLAALRRATGAVATTMERHCLRVFLMIERMASDGALAVDREVAFCASCLFDIGVYPVAATADVYTADGRRFARDLLEPFAWPAERLRRCLDAIERHHQLTSQWLHGAEVELLRRADLVDAFPRVFRFGLPRAWLDDLFRRVPRDGLYAEIGAAVGRMWRERRATIPRIFMPPRPR